LPQKVEPMIRNSSLSCCQAGWRRPLPFEIRDVPKRHVAQRSSIPPVLAEKRTVEKMSGRFASGRLVGQFHPGANRISTGLAAHCGTGRSMQALVATPLLAEAAPGVGDAFLCDCGPASIDQSFGFSVFHAASMNVFKALASSRVYSFPLFPTPTTIAMCCP